VVDVINHGNRDGCLGRFNILGFFDGADRCRRTGQKGLHGEASIALCFGLVVYGGLAVDAIECVWSHPAAGVTVDAASIDVEVAWGVLGAAVG
jgi:hypothetical protein